MSYEFYLDFPPSVNNYYVKTRRGVFISSKGQKFRASTAEKILGQLAGLSFPEDTRLLLEVIVYPPDKRKRDLDNYMKPLQDAITHAGLWDDDSQIDQLFIYRGAKASPNGMVWLRISPAGPVIPVSKSFPLP